MKTMTAAKRSQSAKRAWTTMRQQAWEIASLKSAARRLGFTTRDLELLAREFMAVDHAHANDVLACLQSARSEFEGMGFGNILNLKALAANGRDHDSFHGLDVVAEDMARQFPHLLRHDPEAELFALLTQGNPTRLSKVDAYRKALTYLEGVRDAA